ncbi:Zn-dependent exopeptidase [Trametes sanguinea]|nr:Zn-dependent exopeptidase [Trametes sanguinea]
MLSLPLRASRTRLLLPRSPTFTRTMSSSIYVLPVDPTSPSTPSAPKANGLDAARLWQTAPGAAKAKAGTTHLFYGEPAAVTALTSLGEKFAQKKGAERREAVRKAVGSAVKKVRDLGEDVQGREVLVDASADAHAAAVAAHLAAYKFTLKTKPTSPFDPRVPHSEAQPEKLKLAPLGAADKDWETGVVYAKAQNLARTLMELPANIMTPTAFAERVKAEFAGVPNVEVIVRDAEWAAQKGMNTFLSVTKGTSEPAKFLEIVYAMNGKSIEIDNTDAEGRLILSDAIYYGSTEYKPHTLIDVATLTGSMDYGLGEVYSGVFTVSPRSIVHTDRHDRCTVQNSDSLWNELHAAGEVEYDRFWRMPLDEEYGPQIYSSNADLCNTGGKRAGCCTAALFLKSFVEGVEPADGAEEPSVRWAHLDIAGSMEASRGYAYQEKGMTGRPTRALIEFARRLSQQ